MSGGTTINLPEMDYTDVQVYSPEAGHFDNPLVMNFANAHKPGDCFRLLLIPNCIG